MQARTYPKLTVAVGVPADAGGPLEFANQTAATLICDAILAVSHQILLVTHHLPGGFCVASGMD